MSDNSAQFDEIKTPATFATPATPATPATFAIPLIASITQITPIASKPAKQAKTSRVYTKRGDLGYTTMLGSSDKVPKWDSRISAYGAVDELDAHLGKVREILSNLARYKEVECPRASTTMSLRFELAEDVDRIQQRLFIMSSWLARSDYLDEKTCRLNELDESMVTDLETSIDQMTERLPVLKNFILQQGDGTCDIHIARTVCRRAESRVVKVVYRAEAIGVDQYRLAIIYLNRLSDWLFTAARYYAHSVGQCDVRL